jgi:hypothetical protein
MGPAGATYEGYVRLHHYRPRPCDSGLSREGIWNPPTFGLTAMIYRRELWNCKTSRIGFAFEMILMSNHLFKVVSLAALVVFPAYGQNLSVPDHVVAMTTNLQFITEDDVDQRTKLDLLLEQKQIDREGVIRELSSDIFKIEKAEGAGLLSDALVDKAFADMCSRRGVAPADLMKTLEDKGIRLDALRKRLRSDVARERLARMPSHRYEDRLDHPLIPKK